MPEKTLGAKRVRADFNAKKLDSVTIFKNQCAILIDMLEENRNESCDPDAQRLISVAQTQIEQAAMWGVKALTA